MVIVSDTPDMLVLNGHWTFDVCLFVLLLYVPSQQLWSLQDGKGLLMCYVLNGH